MSTFQIDCELGYDVAAQTVFVLNLAAPDDDRQRVLEECVELEPALGWDELREPGTSNRFIRVDVPPGDFAVRYLAAVDVMPIDADLQAAEVPIVGLPGEAFACLRASRYCEADAIFNLACRLFGQTPPGYGRVDAICRWIRENIDYVIGTSTPSYSARDVLAQRVGVCRDFAHLAIAFCRALNIPARFVTGYAQYADPPPDFHAVFEAFLGNRWQLFDPTELSPTRDLVRIGTGRDASEVPFATFFGTARLRRLSPLVQSAPAGAGLARQQTPTSGILLAA
ncbi:MAG: transglutaminase-like domain-containing protein [Casimicrobiaceae bacterium]